MLQANIVQPELPCAFMLQENVSCFADMDNQARCPFAHCEGWQSFVCRALVEASATVQGLHGSNVTLNASTLSGASDWPFRLGLPGFLKQRWLLRWKLPQRRQHRAHGSWPL